MRINSVYFNKLNLKKQNSEISTNPIQAESQQNSSINFAYRDFSVSFGDRLNRTPENFYAQPFNRENMPDTAKKYLLENYAERHHMPPAQLQREAYQYLMIADSVQDVKDMYPDEPLFDGLRTLDDTKPSVGTLLMLKWDKQISDTPVFKDPENKDLTVYLLKKVYLEGKTVEEINKDFDKDATDEIKRELGIDDKKYFSSTNLRTLGIRYPKLPYYNSFLATRNDKEYIPPIRTSSTHTVSSEARQKLSESAKTWWAGLNELERMEQIQKMMNGKEFANSIFDRFKGPIMTLAASKMNFSEKLSAVFAEKLSDENFKDEFPTFEEQQREIMLEFWNKDPEFRKNYSMALKSIIADFDFAYHEKENPEYLEDLLNQALEQKSKILENAKLKRRECSATSANPKVENDVQETIEKSDVSEMEIESPSYVRKVELSSKELNIEFKNVMKNHVANHSKIYGNALVEASLSRIPKSIKLNLVAFSKGNPEAYLGNVDLEKTLAETTDALEHFYKKFDDAHLLLSRANNIVVASEIFDITGELNVFRLSNFELSQYSLPPGAKAKFKEFNKTQNKTVESLAVLAPREGTRELYGTSLYPEMMLRLTSTGFDTFSFGDDDENGRKGVLKLMQRGLTPDTDEIIKELQKYNAPLSFVCNEDNDARARAIVFERVIQNLITWQIINAKTEEEALGITTGKPVKYQNPKTLFSIMSAIRQNKHLDIDYNSTSSLKIAFGKLLHDSYLKNFDEGFQMKFIDYAISHPAITKDKMVACMFVDTGAIDNYDDKIPDDKREKFTQVASRTIISLIEDFRKEYPLLMNANEFALKEAFANVTNKNRVDIWVDDLFLINKKINDENRVNEIEQQRHFIRNSADKYQEILPVAKLSMFYKNYFAKGLETVKEQSGCKDISWNPKFNKTVLEVDKRLSRDGGQELELLYKYIQQNRGRYEYVKNSKNPVDARRTVMMTLIMDYIDMRSAQIF